MAMPPVGALADEGDTATCGLRAVNVKKARPRFGSAAIRAAEMTSAGPVRLGLSRGSVEIGRASCRGRGEISVVAVSLKKKKKRNQKQAGQRIKQNDRKEI